MENDKQAKENKHEVEEEREEFRCAFKNYFLALKTNTEDRDDWNDLILAFAKYFPAAIGKAILIEEKLKAEDGKPLAENAPIDKFILRQVMCSDAGIKGPGSILSSDALGACIENYLDNMGLCNVGDWHKMQLGQDARSADNLPNDLKRFSKECLRFLIDLRVKTDEQNEQIKEERRQLEDLKRQMNLQQVQNLMDLMRGLR